MTFSKKHGREKEWQERNGEKQQLGKAETNSRNWHYLTKTGLATQISDRSHYQPHQNCFWCHTRSFLLLMYCHCCSLFFQIPSWNLLLCILQLKLFICTLIKNCHCLCSYLCHFPLVIANKFPFSSFPLFPSVYFHFQSSLGFLLTSLQGQEQKHGIIISIKYFYCIDLKS